MANRSASWPSFNPSRAQVRSTSCSNTLTPLNLPRIHHSLTLFVRHSLFINSFVLSFHPVRKNPYHKCWHHSLKEKRKPVRLLWWLWSCSSVSFYRARKFSLLRGKISIPHWAHNGPGETQALQNTWAWHSHLELEHGLVYWTHTVHGYNVRRCLQGYLPRSSSSGSSYRLPLCWTENKFLFYPSSYQEFRTLFQC